MLLLKMVADAMRTGDVVCKNAIHDYIMDISHPETEHYCKLLRNNEMKMKDYLSLLNKFGTKRERKLATRVRRKTIKVCKKQNSHLTKKNVLGYIKHFDTLGVFYCYVAVHLNKLIEEAK